MLLGAWSPQRPADIKLLTRLGSGEAEVTAVCMALAQQAPAQVIHQTSPWQQPGEPSEYYLFANHRVAWALLAPLLQPEDLERFGAVLLDVLQPPVTEEDSASALSQKLRHGLLYSLAVLGNSEGRLAMATSPAAWAARIVSALLLDGHGPGWQLAPSELQLLAEAAPETFLAVLHERTRTVKSDSTLADGIPPKALRSVSNALAVLALDAELFERTVFCLAALAEAAPAPSQNVRDAHPLQVLAEIFDFGDPKTSAPIEDRLAALRQLAKQSPAVTWSLLMMLLTRKVFGTYELPRAQVLRISVPPRDRPAYHGEGYGQVQAFLNLAQALAGHDAERWAQLVEQLDTRALPEELVLRGLEELTDRAPAIHDEQGRLWAALRGMLHRLSWALPASGEAEHPADSETDSDPSQAETAAEWKLLARIQSCGAKLYEQLTPSDFAQRNAWTFSLEHPPQYYGAIQDEHKELQRLQKACIAELALHPSRWEVLGQLAQTVQQPYWLARQLADSDWAAEVESRLLTLKTFAPYERLAPVFLALRLLPRDPAEAEALLRQLVAAGRPGDAVQLALNLTGSEESTTADARESRLWDLLEELPDATVHRDYWQQLPYTRLYGQTVRTQAAVDRVIRQLWAQDHLGDAMRVARDLKQSPTYTLVLDLLSAVAVQLQAKHAAQMEAWGRLEEAPDFSGAVQRYMSNAQLSSNDKHIISELLRHLHPQGPDELRRTEQVEAALLPWLTETNYVPRFLPTAVRIDPKLFIALTQTPAGNALVMLWQGFPGDDLPPEEAAAFLTQWAKQVLALLSAGTQNEQHGLSLLAQLLSRPTDSDKQWPQRHVRDLLQQHIELLEPLRAAMRNPLRPLRMYYGGAQRSAAEESLARCQAGIVQFQAEWPHTARLLTELAAYFSAAVASYKEWESRDSTELSMPAIPITQQPLFPLQQVLITDFRGAARLELPLHPRLTILYGKNASGKTTVLDAIAIGLAPIARRLLGRGDEQERQPRMMEADRRTIWRTGKKPEKAKRVSVLLQGQSQPNQPPLQWSIETPWTTRGPEVGDRESPELQPYLDAVSEALRVSDDAVPMPVFAYYGVDRVVSRKAKDDARPLREAPSRAAGLAGALHGAAQFETAVQWFRSVEDIEVRRKLRQPSYQHPALAAVRTAVRTAIKTQDGASIDSLWVDADSTKLRVQFTRPSGGVEDLEIGQLSDGFRTHLALVLDLARRLEQCNPTSDEGVPRDDFGLRSRAVVLIDEVDLHLHPAWQQTVLRGLLDAFPLTQFVVTTHSPLVLGSMKDAEAWVYSMEDTKAEQVSALYGENASLILRDWLGTTPRALEVANQIEQIKELLDASSFEKARAQTDLLEQQFGSADPDVATLRSLLFFMAPRKEGRSQAHDEKASGSK